MFFLFTLHVHQTNPVGWQNGGRRGVDVSRQAWASAASVTTPDSFVKELEVMNCLPELKVHPHPFCWVGRITTVVSTCSPLCRKPASVWELTSVHLLHSHLSQLRSVFWSSGLLRDLYNDLNVSCRVRLMFSTKTFIQPFYTWIFSSWLKQEPLWWQNSPDSSVCKRCPAEKTSTDLCSVQNEVCFFS